VRSLVEVFPFCICLVDIYKVTSCVSCVLGLRPFALFNEFLLIKKKIYKVTHSSKQKKKKACMGMLVLMCF